MICSDLCRFACLPVCLSVFGLDVWCLSAQLAGNGVMITAHAQVRMGFPQKAAEGPTAVAFVGADCTLRDGGFTCPRCKARVLDLPSTCHVCGLTLVSSSQLARSYHHLFPVKPFVEIASAELPSLVRKVAVACASVPADGILQHPCLWTVTRPMLV